MQVNARVVVAIALFVAFSIGLNLGLHGVISLHHADPTAQLPVKVQTQSPEVGHDTASSVPLLTTKPVVEGKPQSVEPPSVAVVEVLSGVEQKMSEVLGSVNTKIRESTNLLKNFDPISGKIPIVLLTCNRPQLLEITLASLLKINGVTSDQVLVIQDGTMTEVANIVKKAGLTLIQNTAGLRGTDGGSRIATHYKFSLSSAFDRFPDAEAIIIVEDDLLFSPDFYEYFTSVLPLMTKDPSVFVVSAWNDNGFKVHVRDAYALKRTEYFPGLGWLLTRKLYKEELEQHWPREHWDHWLRSPTISKNREIVYPEVPRTYHNGVKGTFMDQSTHNKYFANIGYNTDSSVHWNKERKLVSVFKHEDPLFLQAESTIYELKIQQLIKACKHIDKINDLLQLRDEIVCIWIDVNPSSEWRTSEFEPIAQFFTLWHEHRRAGHKGLHDFYWEGNYILVLNIFKYHDTETYAQLKPVGVKFMDPKVFDKSLTFDLKRKRTKIDIVKSTRVGQSCDEVCQSVKKECYLEHLQLLNSCEVMKEHFKCNTCKKSVGAEQPAYVDPSAAKEFGPGDCVVNAFADHTTCSASHKATSRLCACH